MLAVVSVLVFAYGVARPVAKYRRGTAAAAAALRAARRLRDGARGSLLAPRLDQAPRPATPAGRTAAIFYGFVVAVHRHGDPRRSTPTSPSRFFGWRFFEGNFYLGYSLVLDVLGLALLGGVVLMMVRRGIIRPRKLDYTRPDREPGRSTTARYRVGRLGVRRRAAVSCVVTGYVLEGVRIAMDQPGYNELLAGGLGGRAGLRRARRRATAR